MHIPFPVCKQETKELDHGIHCIPPVVLLADELACMEVVARTFSPCFFVCEDDIYLLTLLFECTGGRISANNNQCNYFYAETSNLIGPLIIPMRMCTHTLLR